MALYAPGEAIPADPRGLAPEAAAAPMNEHAERARLVMTCWFGDVTLHEFNVSSVMKAVGKGDARRLYEIDRELVPSWCPTCAASYCGRRWETWDVFDEGFFDEKRGRCPKCHERMLGD